MLWTSSSTSGCRPQCSSWLTRLTSDQTPCGAESTEVCAAGCALFLFCCTAHVSGAVLAASGRLAGSVQFRQLCRAGADGSRDDVVDLTFSMRNAADAPTVQAVVAEPNEPAVGQAAGGDDIVSCCLGRPSPQLACSCNDGMTLCPAPPSQPPLLQRLFGKRTLPQVSAAVRRRLAGRDRCIALSRRVSASPLC